MVAEAAAEPQAEAAATAGRAISTKRNLHQLPRSFFYANCLLPPPLLMVLLFLLLLLLAMHNANTFSLHTFWRSLNKLDAVFVCTLGAGGIGVCVCVFACLYVCRVNYADQTQRLNASTTTPYATTTGLSLPYPPVPNPLDAFEVRSLARRTIVYNFYS